MKMRKQRGAAIVVVMLILLVITVLGITAVRMGLTSLTIATNSQVSSLVFQSADSGLVSFEQQVSAGLYEAGQATGVIGPALNAPGSEVIYCVTKGDRFRLGGCQADVAADFTSARDVAINQVAVEVPANADGEPMKALVLGTDADRAGIPTYRLRVHSTAVIPVFGSADSDDLNTCLAMPNDESAVTVTDCLTDAGAVFTTMVQEYNYGFNE